MGIVCAAFEHMSQLFLKAPAVKEHYASHCEWGGGISLAHAVLLHAVVDC